MVVLFPPEEVPPELLLDLEAPVLLPACDFYVRHPPHLLLFPWFHMLHFPHSVSCVCANWISSAQNFRAEINLGWFVS